MARRAEPGAAAHESRPGYLVGRLDRLFRRRFEEVLAGHGLTLAQYTTLSVAAARPGLSSAQLARRALVTAQGMNTIVNALESAGLLARTPHEDGGRALRVRVTDAGSRLLAVCDRQTRVAEDELLGALSPQERAVLVDLLEVLTAPSGRTDIN